MFRNVISRKRDGCTMVQRLPICVGLAQACPNYRIIAVLGNLDLEAIICISAVS